jgi:type II secretory pathway pseudopilin PulG
MRKSASSAYTVVELMVVLAIVSFMATTGYAAARNVQKRVEDARTKADIEQIKLSLEVYYQENGGYPNPQNPPFPASTDGTKANDGTYCIGTPTCTLSNVSRLGFTPTGTSSIPTFYLSNLTKYIFGTNQLTQGYFYACVDPLNPNVRPAATPFCPPNYNAVLYYGLHSAGTIVSVTVGGDKTSTLATAPEATDCPFPGAKSLSCSGGSTPPAEPIFPDVGPYSPNQPPPPPPSTLTVSCSASCTQTTPVGVNPPQFSCIWTATTGSLGGNQTGPGTYAWSGDYTYTGSSPSAGTSYSGAGTKNASVNVSIPTDTGTKTGSASCSVTFGSAPTTYTITIQQNRNGTMTQTQPTVTSGGNYTYNAPAYSGYTVQSMVVDGVNRGAITTWSFTNVTANHTIVVNYAAIPNLAVSCTGTRTAYNQIRWQATPTNAQGSVTYGWTGVDGSANYSSYGSSNIYYVTYASSGSKSMGVTAYDAATGQQASASCSQSAGIAAANLSPWQRIKMAASRSLNSVANAFNALIGR